MRAGAAGVFSGQVATAVVGATG